MGKSVTMLSIYYLHNFPILVMCTAGSFDVHSYFTRRSFDLMGTLEQRVNIEPGTSEL
jgi:hypothetical protein